MIFCDLPRESKIVRRLKPTRVCAGCGDTFTPHKHGGHALYCIPCREKSMRVRGALSSKIKQAIKRGELAPITADTKCIDCGSPAYGYEHRDYSKPLDVVPICRRCNWRRGAAGNLSRA